jgi:hypothetical protein
MPQSAPISETKQISKFKSRKFKAGTNYSLQAVRSIDNLCKNEKEAKKYKSTLNLKNLELTNHNCKTDFCQTEATEEKAVSHHEMRSPLEFLPFVQERDGMGKIINKVLIFCL